MPRPTPIALVAIVLLPLAAFGQDGPTEQLEAIRAQQGVPALAAHGVRWDGPTGAIVPAGPWAVGQRVQGVEAPATAGDLWHVGSCTKAFTATLLATYVAEGRVRWTDTIREALPETCEALGDKLSEHAAAATLADVVRHRAGLPPNASPELMGRLFTMDAQVGRAAILREALTLGGPPPAEGEAGVYANSGYVIAGAVCERLGSKPWEALLAERVLMPLGIGPDAFGFGPPPAGQDLATPTQPVGHRAFGKDWVPQVPSLAADNPVSYGPAGTLHLTMDAWGRFAMAHARGDDLGDGERDALGLSRKDYAELHRPAGPPEFAAAAGWFVGRRPWARGADDADVGAILTHSGTNTMWFATLWIAPERDAAILSAANAGGQPGAVATDAAVGVALRELDRDPPK